MALQEDKIDRYAILLDRGNEVFERMWNDVNNLKSRNATLMSIILATLSINLTLLLFLYQTGWRPSCVDTFLLIVFVISSFIALCITFSNLWPTDYRELNVLEIKYLFSWDNVPGKDNKKLLKYIRDNYDVSWMKSAEIDKSEDGKIIRISKDKNSVEIMIDKDKRGEATLTSDDITYKLKVRRKNGRLNVYNDTLHNLLDKSEEKLLSHFIVRLQKAYNYNADKYSKRMWLFVIALGLFIVSITAFIWLLTVNIIWR